MLRIYKNMPPDEYEAEMHKLSAKPLLTRNEACEYFHIGLSRMSVLIADKPDYVVFNGNKALIDREAFFKFLTTARRV